MNDLSKFLPFVALAAGAACYDPSFKTDMVSEAYPAISMGETPCGLLGRGEAASNSDSLTGYLLPDPSWADRVRDVLESDGITVRVTPDDASPMECYGSDAVTPQSDGVYRFHFPTPVTNQGEVWQVIVAYPEEVYDTYASGYLSPSKQYYENWELACYDQASDSRPDGNYGAVWAPNDSGENLTTPGDSEGWDCDLRFLNEAL